MCLGEELKTELPYTDYFEYFGPDFSLHPAVDGARRENLNTREYLDTAVENVAAMLKLVPHAPSVQMQDVPRDDTEEGGEGDSEEDWEKRVENQAEYYEDDNDNDSDLV